ncbi:MAG TPA: BamA/TamA family outer membrane protein, partial [Candidatus Eisenbacteria bacterium]|nr:BamA/TamA family outer membrane protein [Candidatus Eisenbacteria bacterium]
DSAALAAALGGAVARLQSLGYLDARVRAAWAADGGPRLAVRVDPGVADRWRALAVDVPREDSAKVAAWLRWDAGGVADPGRLADALAGAVRDADAGGYAWADLGVSDWRADSGRVDVRVSGALGPRVTVDAVRIEGLHATRRDVAERALGRLVGAPYDPAAARAAATRLEQLGVFSRVEYGGLQGGPDWRRGALDYRVEEPRYNRFEGAVGVQGAAGPVGLASLALGNLLGTARAAALSWQSPGRGLSQFEMHYAEPFVLGLPFRAELAVAQQIQDTLYTRTQWGARLGHVLASGERIEAGLEEERVIQPQGDASEADLENTLFSIERDRRDDPVAPRRGVRLKLTATQVFKRETLRLPEPDGSRRRSARESVVELRGEAHRPLGPGSGLALEGWLAGRFSSERVLPDYERFAVGGAATLRGHDEQEFRADRVALTRLEWRRFLGPHGERVALFWDHATLENREALPAPPGVDAGDHEVVRNADGVGAGLQLPAAGGLVDVDYGLAPGRGFLDGKIHLRLVTTF